MRFGWAPWIFQPERDCLKLGQGQGLQLPRSSRVMLAHACTPPEDYYAKQIF